MDGVFTTATAAAATTRTDDISFVSLDRSDVDSLSLALGLSYECDATLVGFVFIMKS